MSTEAPLRLLVIDDDEVDRQAVGRALAAAGVNAEVEEVADGRRALERLRGGSFDCIFLDFHLPWETGLEVIAEARAGGVEAPIVVLTGRGDEETAVELMKAGATDYLPKSTLSPERLGQSLRYALRVSRAERQAREAERALRQAVRDREDVLAVVSHELRNPLHTILLTSIQLLDQGALGPGEQRQVERIRRVTQQMQHLIEDLLDVAQIEAGQLQIERAPVDVAELLNEICESFSPQAEGKALKLECTAPPDTPAVEADRRRLVQVFTNLLGNAVRLSPQGGQIELTAQLAQGALRFAVRDDGPGIATEDLPHIFDRFWQAAGTGRQGGAGLGLTIARGIVEAHGGRIWVESIPGRGSTFYFTIPLAHRLPGLRPAGGRTAPQRPPVRSAGAGAIGPRRAAAEAW